MCGTIIVHMEGIPLMVSLNAALKLTIIGKSNLIVSAQAAYVTDEI